MIHQAITLARSSFVLLACLQRVKREEASIFPRPIVSKQNLPRLPQLRPNPTVAIFSRLTMDVLSGAS
jgi:hypothetical protein